MKWFKQSTDIFKNTEVRKLYASGTTGFIEFLGVMTFLKCLLGDSIKEEEVKKNGMNVTKFTIEEDMFFMFAKTKDYDWLMQHIEKINQSGVYDITLTREEGVFVLEILEMIKELDNHYTQVRNESLGTVKRRDKRLALKKDISTIYATDSQGKQLDHIYRTVNNYTGEEQYFIDGFKCERERYVEFLDNYVD